jgi:transcriptional regulator with XRE-family HTH domain
MLKQLTSDMTTLRLAGHIAMVIADARRDRRWTLRDLADRCGLAVSSLHAIEHGRPAAIETYVAIGLALGLELRLDLLDPRKRAPTAQAEDPVHAAMGEMMAARLAGFGSKVAIDEPNQHYQFAGRADVLAWDIASRALLHVENRTRFPNLQDAIGSYNAKRRYLPAIVAERVGIRGGFASVTNVIAGLWSGEVIHIARLRAATFSAICPDDSSGFEAWWRGQAPSAAAETSAFLLIDPGWNGASSRSAYVGLEEVLGGSVRPRYRGYGDAAEMLRRGVRG